MRYKYITHLLDWFCVKIAALEENMWYRVRSEESFGEALAEIRREAGLSQHELAQRVNVDRMTISRLENGIPTIFTRVFRILSLSGYDLIIVPRGSHVTVEER
jgi:HTH-type transcriptional regulator/antitoxin HipB